MNFESQSQEEKVPSYFEMSDEMAEKLVKRICKNSTSEDEMKGEIQELGYSKSMAIRYLELVPGLRIIFITMETPSGLVKDFKFEFKDEEKTKLKTEEKDQAVAA